MTVSYERYTLTLQHEYVDQDGQLHQLEEPIAVSSYVPHMDEWPSAIVINDMMERLGKYMIQQRGGKNE